MLTKSDIKIIKTLLDPLKQDINTVKTDVKDIKTKVENLTDLATNSFGELFKWTDDIDNNFLKKKIPQRIDKLEQIIKTS